MCVFEETTYSNIAGLLANLIKDLYIFYSRSANNFSEIFLIHLPIKSRG